MLAETGFVAHLGSTVVQTCQSFPNSGYNLTVQPNVDFVLLEAVPSTIPLGGTLPVTVGYNLASNPSATLSVSLMRKGPNLPIASNVVDATPGKHTVSGGLPPWSAFARSLTTSPSLAFTLSSHWPRQYRLTPEASSSSKQTQMPPTRPPFANQISTQCRSPTCSLPPLCPRHRPRSTSTCLPAPPSSPSTSWRP